MDCNTCKDLRKHAETTVSRYAFESAMTTAERTMKRLWIIIIILIILFFGTNAAWVYYESQFETIETTITQENEDGYNNYIGNDGDIYNGEADGNDEATDS